MINRLWWGFTFGNISILVDIPSSSAVDLNIYGSNQSGCGKAKKMGCLPSILLVFLTIYICFALMKITMCFKHLEASHIMSCDS